MKDYKLYFEFFGKNMCTTVKANSEEEAQELIRNKINFIKSHKVGPKEDDDILGDKNIFENLKSILNIK